jgi:predicted amidohydrolase
MRVTIGQINTINGDYKANTAAIISAIEQAKRDHANLVVLPEVAIQGYTSLDWFLDRDVARDALEPLEEIIAATEGITPIVGTVRPSQLPTGRRLFNSAAVISDRKLIGFEDKTLCLSTTCLTIPVTSSPLASAGCLSLMSTKSASQFAKIFGTTRLSGKSAFTQMIPPTN